MSIPLQHSEREGWSRTAPDDARRVTGFSPEFVPGGDFTLGAEEEALLVQRNGRLRTTGAVRLAAALSHAPATAGLVVPDVFANQVELNSAVCDSAESLHRSMRQLREQVRAAGAWLMAVGTHPAAEFGAIRTVVTGPPASVDAPHASCTFPSTRVAVRLVGAVGGVLSWGQNRANPPT